MRRTLINTATILVVAHCMVFCTPVVGYPSADRRTLATLSSARHRDDVIAGSDFLDMYIGTTVNPFVRSRRYPVARSAIDHQNRLQYDRRFHSGVPQSRLTPPQHNMDTQPSFNGNHNERLPSVSSYQNQPNRYSETHSHHAINTAHLENRQRIDSLSNIRPADPYQQLDVGVVADKDIHDAMDSENRVFGIRTVPRTSRISVSTSSTRESAVPKETLTRAFSYEVSDEARRKIPNAELLPRRKEEILNDVINKGELHASDEDEVVAETDDITVTDKMIAMPIARSFSVSSSVQRIVGLSKREHLLRERKLKRTQSPISDIDAFSVKSPKQETVVNEEVDRSGETPSPLSEYTVSVTSEPTTNFDAYSTVPEETSTVTIYPDIETSPTELNEDWTTKSDFSVDTEKTNFLHNTQSPVEGAYTSHEETPVQVVSVKVSSSVEQSHPSTSSLFRDTPTTMKTRTEALDISDYDEHVTTRISKSNTVSLETEERPQAPSIQRSDFSVEESAPSEVTSDPQNGYSSYYSSSSIQSPTSYSYQTTSVGTAPDHQSVPNHYRTRVTSSNSGSRVQFFSKSPSYRRGLSFAPLRKEGLEPGSIEASVVESNRRSYSVQALPRVSVERSSASISQTLSKEPVVASIQRSFITAQGTETASNRDRYLQSKVKYGFGRLRNFQDEKYTEVPVTTDISAEEVVRQDHYNQQKVYAQPEKVYGEPEKVYGEPEKVYGEPEKVNGEPAKVYSVPSTGYVASSKNYEVPEQNYEVDEAVSVLTNGRAHGIQPVRVASPRVTQPPAAVHFDTALKVFDTRQQDPNHKFGYVVEGRDFRKYRVEERTSDGFIVGEYGVVSNDGDSLRGVRYTADGTINPRLIHDTLLKFLSL